MNGSPQADRHSTELDAVTEQDAVTERGEVTEPDEVTERGEVTEPGDPSWAHEASRLAILFVLTRVTLTVIGVVSRALVPGPVFRPMPLGAGPVFSKFSFLDVWGAWDSSWYISIARVGYQPDLLEGPFANYAFFPLFPLLSRAVGWLFDNVFIGGLVVANAALLVACLFLYRLVLLDHDVATARRTVKYLFAAPGAFYLSGMLTESLYLALVVMCFYFARTRRWWLVGACGLLLTLSRGPGVLTGVPLLWIYLSQRGFSLRRLRPDVLWLAALPIGILVFMWMNYELTGDPLAFAHIQTTGWGHRLQNPLTALWREMTAGDVFNRFNASYMFGVLAVTVAFLRKLGVAYGAFALLSVLFALAYGPPFSSLLRYSVVIFPLYIVLARFTRSRPEVDHAITIAAALMQGFLMSLWANSSFLTV
ncbi:MAG: hypothetical protein M3N37_07665 [Actinomycetota bacterium]|nr:hypothetical protein [Actinomycetota bacterium]